MEALILEAEARLESCRQAMADPAVAADHVEVQARLGALALAQEEVDRLYARWAELEARVKP
jgi:ATP-binding cassette subfamily F protein uup